MEILKPKNPRIRIGVDVGGTKIEAIALDRAGVELLRRRIDTPHSYPACLTAITALIHGLEEEVSNCGTVGVGIPGAISPATGLVKNANSAWLNGQPIDRDLARVLDRPIRVANDANCFVLSEAVDGAAAGAEVVFGIILGTGVGGGIVVRGSLVEGHQRIAGEWGHNPLPWVQNGESPGHTCYCGQKGCIETVLSGPGLQRDHQATTGENLSSPAIVEAWIAGQANATATMTRYFERLARSIATVINLIDPQVVVLGGGLSNIPTMVERTETLLPKYVFSDQVSTRIVVNRHGDSSGVRGAAWLWPVSAIA